jgi:hypothetical protein
MIFRQGNRATSSEALGSGGELRDGDQPEFKRRGQVAKQAALPSPDCGVSPLGAPPLLCAKTALGAPAVKKPVPML